MKTVIRILFSSALVLFATAISAQTCQPKDGAKLASLTAQNCQSAEACADWCKKNCENAEACKPAACKPATASVAKAVKQNIFQILPSSFNKTTATSCMPVSCKPSATAQKEEKNKKAVAQKETRIASIQ